MATVTIIPSNLSFPTSNEETLLDSALQAGVTLNYSCKSGACGVCKAKVVSGEVTSEEGNILLSSDEKDQGIVLTCCSRALTDCTLEADYLPEHARLSRKIVPAKVTSVYYPKEDVAVIHFRLPPNITFEYLPGQYVDLNYGGVIRSYSIANNNAQDGIELHIRKVMGGEISEKIFPSLSENTLMRMDGPLGTFFVRKSDRPIIFLAGGTGFAPVKAMVEQMLAEGDNRTLHIYWGGHTQQSFYSQLPELWSKEHSHIHYIPVVSGDDSHWVGRTGLVHQAVMEDHAELAQYDVYACGTPLMIEAAQQDFTASGLPEDRFFADAFVESAH